MLNHIDWPMIWSLLTAALISYIAIPPIVKVAKQKGLVVLPNGRTCHQGEIPMLGGFAIFASILGGTSLFISGGYPAEFQYFVPAFLIIFLVGLKDDIVHISANTRLFTQVIAGVLIIVIADVRITTFHGLFGIEQLPYWISCLFSLFVFMCIVNAYNLIDGIDGLASGLGILNSAIFGIWLYRLGYPNFGVLAFAVMGGLIPFYIFNVFGKKYKLFMGDSGSTLLGTVFAILAMKILCCTPAQESGLAFSALPAIVIAVMIIPLTDMLRIVVIRLVQGKSPFAADRNHFHHYLIKLGFNHWQASTLIITINLVMILIAFFCRDWGARYVIYLTVGSTFLIMVGVKFLVTKGIVINTRRQARRPASDVA